MAAHQAAWHGWQRAPWRGKTNGAASGDRRRLAYRSDIRENEINKIIGGKRKIIERRN